MMQKLAIYLNEKKIIGGTEYSAYRCPSCKKKFWAMSWTIDKTCKCSQTLGLMKE